MSEFTFVIKALGLAALIIFVLQIQIGPNTIERRVVYGLEQSSVAVFLQEAATGGAWAIQNLYGYGQEKIGSVFSLGGHKKKNPHQKEVESEDEASRY